MIEGKDYFIKKKSDSALMRFLGKLLFFNPDFMTKYTTVVFNTIYAPDGHVSEGTLAHELKHIEDINKWGILYYLSYWLLLPTGFTMRAYWEKRGYAESIKWMKEHYPGVAKTPEYKELIVQQFIGSSYFWMSWNRKPIEKWFDSVLAC